MRVFLAFLVLLTLTSVYSITRTSVPHAQAAAPTTLNFQARLLTSSGNLVPDGIYNVEFKIYNASTSTGSSQGSCTGDANCLWTETRVTGDPANQQIVVKNGYLSAYLGDKTALPSNIWNQQLWLTMNIGGTSGPTWDGEMSPRIRLTSVPFAFRASVADSAETLSKNTGSFTGTVDFANMTANRTFLFPDTSLATTGSPGTICVYNGTASNCPAASGSAYYIQNDTVLQTAANFNLQARDSGVSGTVAGVLRGAAGGQTADLLQFQASNGTVLASVTATGDLQVANSIDTLDSNTLSIGTTAATAISISQTGVTTTIEGILVVDESATFNDNVEVAAQKTIRFIGGATGDRPIAPQPGTMYFDTTTQQLLIYANGKWQADRNANSKVVAASNASQAIKDAADYVADGTADDVQINQALTAAAGGTVYLTGGTFEVTQTIAIPDNTVLAGAGESTILQLDATSGTNLIENASTPGVGIIVRDLRLDGTLGTGTQHAIYFDGLNTVVNFTGNEVERVAITNWTVGEGLYATGGSIINGVNKSSLSSIKVDGVSTIITLSQNIVTGAVDVSNGSIANFLNNVVSGGVTVTNGQLLTVTGNSLTTLTMDTSYAYTISDNNISSGIVLDSVANTNIMNNVIARQGVDALRLISSDYVRIIGNRFADDSGSGAGINITDATSNNTYIANNDLGGMSLVDNGTDTTIAGQLDASNNYLIQPAGDILLNANTTLTGDLTVNGNAGVVDGIFSVSTSTATDDSILLGVTAGGAAGFIGSITNADLTAARSWILPNVSGTFLMLGATGVQADATNNSSIFINKTSATGSLLQLQRGGTDVFTVDNTGNLNTSGTITVTNAGNDITTGTNQDLTVVANGSGIINLNDNVTVGNNLTVGSSAGSGTTLTNNGSTVNSTLALTNFASGGAIGTAAATVDIYTSLSVNQTTASQTLTIPTPTANTTYGRIIYISNIGTASFTMLGSTLNPGATATVMWANTNGGASWVYAGADAGGIQNQNTADQSANFRISGTGRANTSFQAPAFDTASAVALALGTTNATNITLGHNAGTLAIDQTNFDLSTAGVVTLLGGQTADITTQANQNLTIQANGSGTISLNDTVTITGSTTFSGVATDITTGTNEDLTVVANGSGTIVLNDTVTAAGTLTFSGVATDVTTATNEDLTVVANGTGTIVLNDTVTVAGTVTYSNIATDITTGTNEDLVIDANGSGVTQVNDNFRVGASAGSGTTFTNNGSSVASTLALTNFASGGSIGSAATTVDIYTSISVSQTTGSQTLTLPTPTANTTYGRILYLSNVGTASFNLLNSTLNAGATATLMWANTNGGAAWVFAGADGTSINNQKAAGQNGDFWIQAGGSSTGIGRADGGLQAPSLERASAGTLSLGTTSNTTAITMGSTNLTGNLNLDSGASSTINIGSSASARTINIGNVAAVQGITIGSTNSTSTLNLQSGTGTATGDINIGDVAVSGKIIDIGSVTNSATTTVRIATDASAAQTVTVGSSNSGSITTVTGGAYSMVVRNTGVGINTGANAPTGDLTFGDGANRLINVLTRTSSGAGNNLSVVAGAANGSNNAGGMLYLQGGAAGTGNANGGGVTINGGAGVGTGAQGLVALSTSAFTSLALPSFGTDTNVNALSAGAIDLYSSITANASTTGRTLTINAPTISTVGRVLYVANVGATYDFNILLAGTSISIALKPNTTATLIWNGNGWTAAGASSSTDLQAAYNNTLTSAGGAELVLNAPGGAADGLTIRNNATTPIVGGILEVQSSIATNLFSVNNNATEYVVNGGAEVATNFSTNWTSTTGGTITQSNDAGYVATGQYGVKVVTTTTNHGAKNVLSSALTSGVTYSVSFAVKAPTNFATLDVRYSPDGTTSGTTQCATAQTVTSANWSRILCTFTASGSINSSNALLIRQTDATGRTFYIDNLSVTVNANMTFASEGSVNSSLGSAWAAYDADGGGATSTPSVTSSPVYDGQYAVADVVTGVSQGVRNNMAVTPAVSTQYLVTFYARASTGTATVAAGFLPAGGSGLPVTAQQCVDYNTQSVTTGWQRITCIITTPSSGISDPDLVIYQTDATSRSLYIDALTVNLNNNNSNNVQIGGANKGGPTTLLTLDRASTAPIAANNDAYLGSMYYDTTTGRIQCYEADGWGACGSSPDNIVTLTPEYTGAVLGTPGDVGLGNVIAGIGVMTSEFCSNETGVLVSFSGASNLCAAKQARNYYHWTTPQSSEQVYSIFVNYKLPATFKEFNDSNTIKLTTLTSSLTNGIATLQVFRKPSSSANNIVSCGSATTINTAINTWEQTSFGGDERSCGFAGGDSIIFKIDMKSQSNGNIYVENLDFSFTNN